MSELSDTRIIRFFPSDWKKINRYVKKYPKKFSSASHFVRAAIIQLERQLDKEENICLHDWLYLRSMRGHPFVGRECKKCGRFERSLGDGKYG